MTPTPSPVPFAPISNVVEWGSIAEWAAVGVALIALVLSATALWYSLNTTRRLSYLAFEERLQTLEASEGRRVIYSLNSLGDAERLLRRRKDDWDRANHAVSLWNTLAQYAKGGFVNKKLAVAMWGDAVVEAWPHLENLIRYRRKLGRADKWTSLVWFAKTSGACISQDLEG